ncbi:MAG: hypothetical protein ACK4QW_16675 [Alphaproteobacteria bacterium]
MPDFDSPTARAYAVRAESGANGRLFALAFESFVPRIRALHVIAGTPPTGLIGIAAHGIVDWPPLGRRTVLAVCERPEGGRVDAAGERLTAQEAIQRVIRPACRTLRALSDIGLTHRALRPDNMYWADGRRSSVILGECFSSPPGFDQPVAYETTANGAAHPAGRQDGSPAEDLYALGVVVLALTQHGAGWRDALPAALLARKLEFGSASALMGGEPPPPELMPMLRGLLADDPDIRWSLDDLEAWLRQERIPHHAVAGGSGGKSLRIGSELCRSRTAVSAAMAADPRAGAAAARSGAIADWLRSGARDPSAAQAVDGVVRAASRFAAQSRDADDLLAARIAMLVDPDGPIRYRGLSLMPDAFGTLLAERLARGESRDELLALVRSGLLVHAHAGAWSPGSSRRGDALQFAALPGLGAGLERVAYDLNPDLPCLSPAIASRYAVDLAGCLEELEAAARTADFQNSPLDPHSAAFIASRLGLGRQGLTNLSGRGLLEGQRCLAELRLLSSAQTVATIPRLPLLTNWLAHRTGSLAARLRNRRTRKRIAVLLNAATASGRLAELLAPFETQRLWEEDRSGFEHARLLHGRAVTEITRLRTEEMSFARHAAARGREIAVAVSAFAGFAVVALVVAMRAF